MRAVGSRRGEQRGNPKAPRPRAPFTCPSHFRGRRAGMAEPAERDLASRTPEAGLSSRLSPRALRANVQASWAPGEGGGRGGVSARRWAGEPPEEGLTSATPRATGGRGGSGPGPRGCARPPPPPRPPARPVSPPRPCCSRGHLVERRRAGPSERASEGTSGAAACAASPV